MSPGLLRARPLLVVAALVAATTACAGWLKPPDTLTQVPAPASSSELAPLVPRLRALYATWFPDRELLELYPAEEGWRPLRHPDTGVLLGRESDIVVGAKDGTTCSYVIYEAHQDSLGGSWSPLDLRYPQGPAGDRELRKYVDCATVGSGSKTAARAAR